MRNKINNKRYIGQTIQEPPQTRITQHFMESYNKNDKNYNLCLCRAIRKYGRDAFDWALLAEDVEDSQLDILEEYFIDLYRTIVPAGYNMTAGGSYPVNQEIYNLIPNEDYSNNPKVVLDEITDEDVERFLQEL